MTSEKEVQEKLDAKADELIKKYKTKIDNAIEKLDSEGRLRSIYGGQASIGIYLIFSREIKPELEEEAFGY